MDDDELREYYEGKIRDAEDDIDTINAELNELEKKHKKNEELTEKYKKLSGSIKDSQVAIKTSNKYESDAKRNLNTNFKGPEGKKMFMRYLAAYNRVTVVKENLKECSAECELKLKDLASEKKELERKILDKKDERKRKYNTINYYRRFL